MANLLLLLLSSKFLFTIFLLHSTSYSIFSSAYTLPEKHFINCGSDQNNTPFTADVNSDSFTHSSGETSSGKVPTGLSSIYETARVFKQFSWYELETVQNGTYMVRLHFYPFTSPDNNLSDAQFDVLASGFLLLSNFSVPQKNPNSPVIKEFLFPVNTPNLRIYFRPSQESSFAFVNAIEAFVTPQDFVPESSDHVNSQGNNNMKYDGVSSSALTVIHRINVGGSVITPENDTLRRNWVPDDDYLFSRDAAKNVPMYGDRPNYSPELNGATQYGAPDFVYRTAKQMNIDDKRKANFFNVSWHFGVDKKATHFVRFHFCDIVSVTRNQSVFNLYVYGLFSWRISPYEVIAELAAPFYIDFVVDSDSSGFLNISIGPWRDSSPPQNAFLNGVEIMQMIDVKESVPEGSGHRKRLLIIIIGSVAGGIVLIFVFGVVLMLFRMKSRRAQTGESVDWQQVSAYGGGSVYSSTERTTNGGSNTNDMNLRLKVPLAEILYATKNFDPTFMIGKGGFGKVYKGTLPNGSKVAVKRSESGQQGIVEFETEIMLLSKIRNYHLVSLIGYCDERDEMILVYEFMEKGTLREHLYSSKEDVDKSASRSELSWDQRLEICIGAAKGIHYLHTGLSEPIIHRDIKSTNILLDEKYCAKVADFGISKSGPDDQSAIITDVKGTFGYLDPEYMQSMQLTQKTDVYCFGVVLLEVLCAREAMNNQLPRDQINLADWGLSWQKKSQIEKIIDPLLAGKINPDSLRVFGQTVEKCLQTNGIDRPNMEDVLYDLEYALKLQSSATSRGPDEDSTTDVSWQLPMSGIHRIPSFSLTDSCVSAFEVSSSQLKMDDSRL